MKKHFLFPGQVYAHKGDGEITTVLGSCVAVALFDPVLGISGLNHFLLPDPPKAGTPNSRYADHAMEALLNEVLTLGAQRKHLQAKIYGGGAVVEGSSLPVGDRNIQKATQLLQEMKIPVMEKKVGGTSGRRIVFNTTTFQVEHSFIQKNQGVTGSQVALAKKSVRVVIVDDSATIRHLFQKIFKDRGLQVVGVAANAFEARDIIVNTKPDVVTLDIEMPRMNGVVFLEKLMQHFPIPVVMVSSLNKSGSAAMRALELGAIEFIQKPSQHDVSVLSELGDSLTEKVIAAASSKVEKITAVPTFRNNASSKREAPLEVVAVGGNTGAQGSLKTFISNLAPDTPPVIVTNSVVSAFAEEFAKSLQGKAQVQVRVAERGMQLKMGEVVLAPGGMHVEVKGQAGMLSLDLKTGRPVSNQIPSSDVLFSSLARTCPKNSLCVLLSGFGTDGINGAEKIRDLGGDVWVQAIEEASYPHLPQTAIAQGLAQRVDTVASLAKQILVLREERIAA